MKLSTTLACAALALGLAGAPALAQQHATAHHSTVKQTKVTKTTTKTNYTRHQLACSRRFKSYNARTDQYKASNGRWVRCPQSVR